MKFRQINEALDWVCAGSSKEDIILRLKHLMANDAHFITFLQLAFLENMKISGLPEGMPSTYKPETDMPDGISDTTAKQELRRIKNFIAGGSMERLKPHKREIFWIQMMEGLHWKEAEAMTHIKDQTLLQAYPELEVVCEYLNLPLINKAEERQEDSKSEPVLTGVSLGEEGAFVSVGTITSLDTPVTDSVVQIENVQGPSSTTEVKSKRGRPKKKKTESTKTE